MSTIAEIDAKHLREFALVTAAIVCELFGLFFPWLLGKAWPLWPWILAGVLALWGLVAPASLRPIYRGWMRVGLVTGWVMNRVVLSLVLGFAVVPMGLLMRLLGKDPMRRARGKNVASYRTSREGRTDIDMKRPF